MQLLGFVGNVIPIDEVQSGFVLDQEIDGPETAFIRRHAAIATIRNIELNNLSGLWRQSPFHLFGIDSSPYLAV